MNGLRRNAVLRDAIFRAGLRQNDIAQAAGMSRTVLSQIISGRLVPTQAEQVAIAQALGLPVEHLFSNDTVGAA